MFTRIKGAPDGVVMKQSMYDGFGAWEVTSATNQWKQVGNTIQLKDNHVGKDSLFRIEAWEVSGGDKSYVYQQTSPMLSISKKLYPWRPAPEDQADSGEFIKPQLKLKQKLDVPKNEWNKLIVKLRILMLELTTLLSIHLVTMKNLECLTSQAKVKLVVLMIFDTTKTSCY